MSTHQRKQTVRTYECNGDLVMRPECVLHWLQDIAEEHASILGFGYEMCLEHGLAWVEIRLKMDIRRMPKWKEDIEVTTSSYMVGPVIAGRDFTLKDADGNTLIAAVTHWALIDVNRRRPVPLKKRLPYFDRAEAANAPTLDDIDTVDGPPLASYRAEQHSVDFNRHINNSAYLVWALDSLPAAYEIRPIQTIRIDFKRESMPGDAINVHATAEQHDRRVFTLRHAEEERARVMISWAPLT